MRKIIRSLLAVIMVAISGAAGAGDLQTDGQLVTTKTDGPPLAVSGTAAVAGLHADRLDSLEGSSLPRSPDNVITVGVTGAHFNSVKEAVDSITSASVGNQYLIRIGPGVYSDSENITLPGYIHLEGAGRDATSVEASLRIEGPTQLRSFEVNAPGIDSPGRALFITNTSTIADLYDMRILHSSSGIQTWLNPTLLVHSSSIEVVGSDLELFGILHAGHDTNVGTTVLQDVDVRVEGSTVFGKAKGIDIRKNVDFRGEGVSVFVSGSAGQWGVVSEQSERVVLTDSDIEVTPPPDTDTGIGLEFTDSSAAELARSSVLVNEGGRGVVQHGVPSFRISNSRIEVSWTGDLGSSSSGVTSEGGSILHSEIHSTGRTIYAESSTNETRVSHSHLAGGAVGGSGTAECRWVTDEGFGTYSLSCP